MCRAGDGGGGGVMLYLAPSLRPVSNFIAKHSTALDTFVLFYVMVVGSICYLCVAHTLASLC